MYHKLVYLVLTCIMCLPTYSKAWAQDTLLIRSTAHAIELAMQSDASIYAAQQRKQVSEQLLSTAYELPRAEIKYTWGHYDGPLKNSAIEVSQEVPFPTLFLKRRKLLKLQAQERAMQEELERTNLALEVANICEDIRHATQRLRMLRQIDSLYAQYSPLVGAQTELSLALANEWKLFQLKHNELRMHIEECELEISSAYRSLMLYVGDQYPVLLQDALQIQILDIDLKGIHPAHLKAHPKIQTLALETAQCRAEAGNLLAEALPSIILGYQNLSAVGEHEIDGRSVKYDINKRLHAYSVGLSIPLDWGAQRAKIRAAKRESAAKEAELEQAKSELLMAMYNAQDELSVARRQYLYYSTQALQIGANVQQASWEAWRAGNINYTEHLLTLETCRETSLRYLKSILRLNKAVNQWNYFLKH